MLPSPQPRSEIAAERILHSFIPHTHPLPPAHLSSAEAPRRARMMSLLRRSVGPEDG